MSPLLPRLAANAPMRERIKDPLGKGQRSMQGMASEFSQSWLKNHSQTRLYESTRKRISPVTFQSNQ